MTVPEGKPYPAAANFPKSHQPAFTSYDEALTFSVLRGQSTRPGGQEE